MKPIHIYLAVLLLLIGMGYYGLKFIDVYNSHQTIKLKNDEIKIKLIESIKFDVMFWGRQAIEEAYNTNNL